MSPDGEINHCKIAATDDSMRSELRVAKRLVLSTNACVLPSSCLYVKCTAMLLTGWKSLSWRQGSAWFSHTAREVELDGLEHCCMFIVHQTVQNLSIHWDTQCPMIGFTAPRADHATPDTCQRMQASPWCGCKHISMAYTSEAVKTNPTLYMMTVSVACKTCLWSHVSFTVSRSCQYLIRQRSWNWS